MNVVGQKHCGAELTAISTRRSGAGNALLAFQSFFSLHFAKRAEAMRKFSGSMAGEGDRYLDLSENATRNAKQAGAGTAISGFHAQRSLGLKEDAEGFYSMGARVECRLAKRYARRGMHFDASEAWGNAALLLSKAGKDAHYELGMMQLHLSVALERYEAFRAEAAQAAEKASSLFSKAARPMLAVAAAEVAGIVLSKSEKPREASEMFAMGARIAKNLLRWKDATRLFLKAAENAPDAEMAASWKSMADECRPKKYEPQQFGPELAYMRVKSGMG